MRFAGKIRHMIVVGAGCIVILGSLLVWDSCKIGRELDLYKDVPVYDNGTLFFRSHGRHYSADGYYYGQKWQCVEYIKRFYSEAKPHVMPDVWGHAKDFFDPELKDGMLNPRRGLVQFQNGSASPPEPDDILIFRDTKYGHVGIVTSVTEHGVEIIQQNILGETRQNFLLEKRDRRYWVREPRAAAGWLRLP